jgi:hypothetical protein
VETCANCSGIATRLKQHYYCQEIMTALGDLAQVNEQGSRLINFLRVLKQLFLASCKNQEVRSVGSYNLGSFLGLAKICKHGPMLNTLKKNRMLVLNGLF